MAEPTFLDRIEGLGARLLFALSGALSLDAASNLGGWLGRTIGPRLAVSRRAERNLRRALPALGDDEIAAIVVRMWDNLGRVVAEYAHLDEFSRDRSHDRVEIVGAEHFRAVHESDKGAIFVSAHYGNWEINAAVAKWNGIDLVQVYRAANNPVAEALVVRARDHIAGGHLAKGPAGARQIVAALKKGRSLGMLVDQKLNAGLAVPFFGRDAMTATAPAEFALRLGVPILPARMERLRGAHFRFTLYPPLEMPATGDRERDVFEITKRITELFEEWIRARPEQWLWLHRRWPD